MFDSLLKRHNKNNKPLRDIDKSVFDLSKFVLYSCSILFVIGLLASLIVNKVYLQEMNKNIFNNIKEKSLKDLVDCSRNIYIALAQILGGAIAGTLTLFGVLFTIAKQDESQTKLLLSQEKKHVELLKRDVLPMLYILSDNNIHIVNRPWVYTGDNLENTINVLCIFKNEGKGIAKIEKFICNDIEYTSRTSPAIVNLNDKAVINIRLCNGASTIGGIYYSDIYGNMYVADFKIAGNIISELYNMRDYKNDLNETP